ncbi:MAG: copper chaperone PCu(A)C [Pseudomonadota bacterium]|nr:copper chaperone PCu(A)C [Pseudomonadota bacterium]
MTRLLLANILLLLAAACARAPAVPSIEVRDAWARATAPGQSTGAVYATLVNGGADDRLVAAATPVATTASLHSSETVNGVAQMRMLRALPIPAEATVRLEPGGTHVMLDGLAAPLVAGKQVALTLRFAKSGTKDVMATVVAPGSR